MQPTPLRGPKILATLKPGFGPNDISIYDGGAADGQAVGPPWSLLGPPYCSSKQYMVKLVGHPTQLRKGVFDFRM
jgi:hypothetical protein